MKNEQSNVSHWEPPKLDSIHHLFRDPPYPMDFDPNIKALHLGTVNRFIPTKILKRNLRPWRIDETKLAMSGRFGRVMEHIVVLLIHGAYLISFEITVVILLTETYLS
jgi:hypothetical protein